MGNQFRLQRIIFAALLATMSIVIKIVFNYIPLPTTIKNIDAFIVIIIVSAILLGPIYGTLVGLVTDLAYIFFAGGNLGLFTVAHMSVGLIPGLFFYFFKFNKLNLILTMLITIPVYVTLTTIALDVTGWMPANTLTVTPRIIRYSITFIPYSFFVYFLVTDSRLQSFSIYKQFTKNKIQLD